MGAGQSSQAVLGSQEHEQLLQKLAGNQDIEYGSAFWNQLLNLQLALASQDPNTVQDALLPHCRQLMVHNPITHNFQASSSGTHAKQQKTPCMLQLPHHDVMTLCIYHAQLISAVTLLSYKHSFCLLLLDLQKLVLHMLDLVGLAQNNKPSLAVANSLHMVSVIIQFIVETCSPSALSMVFEVAANLPAGVQGAPGTWRDVVAVAMHLVLPSQSCAVLDDCLG